MSTIRQNKAPFFISLGIGIFCFISIFGVWHAYGMEMKDDGTMGGCFFTSMEEICTMTFGEHISQWQSMFTATAPHNVLAALLVLLAVVFVIVAIPKRNLLLLCGHYATCWRLYTKHNPKLSIFNPLKEAFSQGILNPKIY